MKISKIAKFFILATFLANIFSCSQDIFTRNQQSQIRFVDLQGNHRKIRLNTPTENAIALTKQGKITEEKLVEEENYKKQKLKEEKTLSYNKYSNPEEEQNPAEKSNELVYTMNLPTEKNDQQNIQKSQEQEFEITKKQSQNTDPSPKSETKSGVRVISETKIPANESTNTQSTDLKKGRYVQAGSFTTMRHAKQHLDKIKNLTNNPKNVNIQSAKVRNKNYYRVVIGPITQKKTANLIINDLKKKGQNSIIIKIR